MSEAIKRRACRALLITPDGQILLMKIEEPSTGWSAWITPGGGISESESAHAGLLRELHEELNLAGATIGPEVWRRFHAFTWEDRNIEQHESYYLVESARFEPGCGNAMEPIEKRAFKQFKWWPIEAIAKSNEVFVPRALGSLLLDFKKNGIPNSPIEVGV
jgi:8-oxo-dGTP pyrophosphatase MutT (NUDIX family)